MPAQPILKKLEFLGSILKMCLDSGILLEEGFQSGVLLAFCLSAYNTAMIQPNNF